MEKRSRALMTAALLTLGLATVGCGTRAIDVGGAGLVPTTTTYPTVHGVAPVLPVPAAVTNPPAAPGLDSATTTTTVVEVEVPMDEIDAVLAGLDETLAGLDQLLNQAAAALAAEEGEINP